MVKAGFFSGTALEKDDPQPVFYLERIYGEQQHITCNPAVTHPDTGNGN
ncbi:MAG: hypothetical protein WC836_17945 [Desulfobacula sp.]